MDAIHIQHKIHTLREQKVMLDFDLALLYGVQTKRLKESVRRNIERFPPDFMFELSQQEYHSLRTQFASLENGKGKHSKYPPFAFTEQGIAMLSGVLSSEHAIQMNIAIMRAFIAVRKMMMQYSELAAEVELIRTSVSNHGEQLGLIYEAIENILDEQAEYKALQNRNRIGFMK
ncbi:MAG: ORF6N domain-containing protein [Sediminibacterium sp. Gen4]|uniref:ORF6N domain-containing protein n=1 Tax=unclassified Sediminibacterium TaxID=2635961 RepID=UPI0015BD6973|nr:MULTISPECIES: ORF6N domain-containing protein [unclassified Sediminibacterium]MBW0161605.1 ORF6N domain-containing protein [Sediminibacterium sp.]MBW0165414.1 ORF6N domain-containing protein [Sediminibacterium sp.]NWK65357.1 ORF6N domain-containing protein [Sediminibacterium sp. Gen4]